MQAGQSPTIINLHGPLTVDRASALKAEIAEALGGERQRSPQHFARRGARPRLPAGPLRGQGEAAATGKELHFLGSVPSKVTKRLAACGFLRGLSEHAEEFESALVGF